MLGFAAVSADGWRILRRCACPAEQILVVMLIMFLLFMPIKDCVSADEYFFLRVLLGALILQMLLKTFPAQPSIFWNNKTV